MSMLGESRSRQRRRGRHLRDDCELDNREPRKTAAPGTRVRTGIRQLDQWRCPVGRRGCAGRASPKSRARRGERRTRRREAPP
jgi:hypothetical protein